MDANDLQKLEIEIRQVRNDLNARCNEIERKMAVSEAVEVEKRGMIQAAFERITRHLERHDGIIGKLVWLVIGAIVSGFMAYVLAGGLNNAL